MVKFTQKQLRALVKAGVAEDVSRYGCKEADELRAAEEWLEQIGYAANAYGCSGMLLKGHKSGKLYAVTSRTQAIYLF